MNTLGHFKVRFEDKVTGMKPGVLAVPQSTVHVEGLRNSEGGREYLKAVTAVQGLKKTLCNEFSCMLQFQVSDSRGVLHLFCG